MTLWSQDCSELVKVLHGCDKVELQRSTGPSSGAVACVLLVSSRLDCPGMSLVEVCASCHLWIAPNSLVFDVQYLEVTFS